MLILKYSKCQHKKRYQLHDAASYDAALQNQGDVLSEKLLTEICRDLQDERSDHVEAVQHQRFVLRDSKNEKYRLSSPKTVAAKSTNLPCARLGSGFRRLLWRRILWLKSLASAITLRPDLLRYQSLSEK